MKVSSPDEVSETSSGLLLADGHVHIYFGYDANGAVDAAMRNLRNASAGARAAPIEGEWTGLFLTERYDCDFFPSLKRSGHVSSEVTETSAGWVFAGRQIATRERMEVLALCCREKFVDGLPIAESLAQARSAGAIPVIPWSPGKWMFGRFSILRDLILAAQPGDFLLADSSLRPLFYPEPSLFQLARERGLGIIAGTDPLPYPGQEKIIGTFGFRLRSGFDPANPVSSVRRALLCHSPDVEIIGQRATPLVVLARLYKNKMA